MTARNFRSDGFTLIEMLVVIVIIMIVSTMGGILFLNIIRSSGVQESGQLFESAFARARRIASNKRVDHYLVFFDETKDRPATLHIVEDLNRDDNLNTYDTSESGNPDRQVDRIQFPENISFQLGSDDVGPLFRETNGPNGWYWLEFGPTGSVIGSSQDPATPQIVNIRNKTWRESSDPPELKTDWKVASYDFVLFRGVSGNPTHINKDKLGKLFIDWEPALGQVMDLYYTNEGS